ncbi:CoA-binding protein [Motiliproteus sp. SC1-56]|uniref:CoA-binding protein n=1 Tax=Motiliproteus sp. SC1-56 TaxID=2799565 RepID=UPI001A8CF5F7|nr:CoA-binding protein [Motiliproteus sp. SC1-56]
MHLQYDDDDLREVLTSTRTIAMVGASPDPQRDSHRVMAYLQARGYRVIPVNPGCAGDEVLGERVFASLEDIPASVSVDMVDVFRRSEAVPEICESAIRLGAKTLWLQLGVVHGPAARRAREYGLNVVMDRCPKIDIPRLGLEEA